jgi:hypothetical protein
MTDPTSPTPVPPPWRPTAPIASGRAVVLAFGGLILVTLVVGLALRLSNQDAIRAAQLKTLPQLAANVTVTCVDPTQGRFDVKQRGRCTNAATLEFTVADLGDGTRGVGYAVSGLAHASAGQLTPGKVVVFPLQGEPPGPHFVSVLLVDGDPDAAGLDAALKATPANDARERLTTVEKHVSGLIEKGLNARAERLAFQVDDAREAH